MPLLPSMQGYYQIHFSFGGEADPTAWVRLNLGWVTVHDATGGEYAPIEAVAEAIRGVLEADGRPEWTPVAVERITAQPAEPVELYRREQP